RIGILGGTFDPIHYGHLIVAEAARTALALDSIVFVPCGQPPHKDPCAITAAEHRYLMTVLATSERRRFRVSRIELDRPGPSYTVDTLREFQRTDGRGAELYFIVGADAFLQMPSWKSPEEVMRLARIVVVNRSGHNGEQLAERLQALQPSLRQRVEIVPSVPIHISAHELRQRLRRGISIRGYVPPPVLTYIEEHALYRS
ncbi:MAG TPA: nicotinate-nucleotide adenylyltransferase, partial [Bacillota bacterium]